MGEDAGVRVCEGFEVVEGAWTLRFGDGCGERLTGESTDLGLHPSYDCMIRRSKEINR